MRFAQRPGPVVVPASLIRNSMLSNDDLGLYVRVAHIIDWSEKAPDVDQVVQLLLAGQVGPPPNATADDLAQSIGRLAAAGVLPVHNPDVGLTEAEWHQKNGGFPQL
ncbi:hypothetical protein [Streptomyces sp. bgisy153]|uniref:hypothetical protein n=1 Tax=Streptomyces sp. bgisy153 TaxID=3413793 RepID=UPI003D72CD4A